MVQSYLITFGKPAGHREVVPREFDAHSRWKPARERAEEKRRRRRRRKKGSRRQSRQTEAASVARFAVTTYWAYSKLVPPPAK